MEKDFGDIIKELREEKNLTRDELANNLNISYSALAKYETNKRFPDKVTLTAIADYFSVSTDYLLGRSNVKYLEGEQGKQAMHYIDAIIRYLDKLNDSGQEEATKRVEELTEIKKYTAKSVNDMALAESLDAIPNRFLIAAHNEDQSKKQKELMEKDIDKLKRLEE